MALVDDLCINELSRYKVREHVDKLIGMTKGKETERVRQHVGESRADRYRRVVEEQGDSLPERIG